MFQRVAIIGGGAAGASLLNELLGRDSSRPLHLDWYTGHGTPAHGVAYGTRSERHLLNVRAASMGMYAHRPGGFLDYAQGIDPGVSATDFLPRRLYGDYLAAETAHMLSRAKAHGHDVRVVPFEVDALVPENDGVTVFHGDAESRVEAAVLALGALPQRPLPGVSAAALDSGRYVLDPWRLLAEPSADPLRHVALIGLGLTAVDVLLELSARWPQVTFTAVSRHGLLPAVHHPQLIAPPEDGDLLVDAMRDAPGARVWLRLLREACAQQHDWRSVIDALRSDTQDLWAVLPDEERARFLRHARWAWERARHRMAPRIGRDIAALESSGRLRRFAARMTSIDLDADGRLRLALVHAGRALEPVCADLVVQTAGLDTDVARTPHPLMRQLATNGHVLPDRLGLGCRAEPDGRLLHDGGAWPRLFAIGSLLRGTLWESVAMPEIRQQARQLADQLLAEA